MLGSKSHLVNAEVFVRIVVVLFLAFFFIFLKFYNLLINVFNTNVAKELFLLPKFFFSIFFCLFYYKQFLFQNNPLHKDMPLTTLYLVYTFYYLLYFQQAAHKLYSSSFHMLSSSFQRRVNLILLLAISGSQLLHSVLLSPATLLYSSPK